MMRDVPYDSFNLWCNGDFAGGGAWFGIGCSHEEDQPEPGNVRALVLGQSAWGNKGVGDRNFGCGKGVAKTGFVGSFGFPSPCLVGLEASDDNMSAISLSLVCLKLFLSRSDNQHHSCGFNFNWHNGVLDYQAFFDGDSAGDKQCWDGGQQGNHWSLPLLEFVLAPWFPVLVLAL